MKNLIVSLICCALLVGCESTANQVKPEAVDSAVVADAAVSAAPEAVTSAAPAPAASAQEVSAPASASAVAPVDATKK